MSIDEIKAFKYPPAFFIQFDFMNGDRETGTFGTLEGNEFRGKNCWRIIESANLTAFNQYGDINLTTVINGSALKSLTAVKSV